MNDTNALASVHASSRPLMLGALALAAALVASVAACVHEVEGAHGDEAPLFLAEGKDLLDQLDDDGDGYRVTPVIAATAPFTRVGVRFDADGPVAIDVRVSRDDGATFGAWRPATVSFHEERASNAFVDVSDDVDVDVDATHLQLRFAAPVESGLSFLAVEALVPAQEGEAGGIDVAGDGTEEQGLAADGNVVTRAQWGARARNCTGASTPNRMTIHHTETPTVDNMTPAARMRQIQNFHIDVRGWCDIGYHFVVAGDGQVYAGRRETVLGAHVGGANSNNAGIALMGSFMTSAPSTTMMNAAARIMRAVSTTYGITLDRTKVKSHRELGSTDCPGNALQNRLGDLVTLARNGSSAQPPTPPAQPPTPPSQPPPSSSGVYGGIDRGTASIPRAGLQNDTLRNTLGMSTEPHGTVVTHQGAQFVRGTVSWFGGPNDTGVTSTETGAVSGERLRSLNSPTNASTSTIASRPGDFYFIAMRWDYTPHGIAFWRNARILVVNPANGAAVVLRVVDWGPNTNTGRVLDISPRAMTDLGADTDDNLLVAFASEGAALGVTSLGGGDVVMPPPPPPPASCASLPASGGVIDDGDDCFTLGGPTQYLHAVEGAGEDGDYVWTGTTDNNSAINFGEWSLAVSAPGQYVIEAFVPSVTSGTTQARYDVSHDGGTSSVVVSQSASGWKRLGSFALGASAGQKVRAGDNTGDTSDRKLVLDALRITPDDGTSEEPTCARLEIVTSGGALNVRPSASTSGAAIGTLDDGDLVDRIETVIGQSVSGTNEWHRIRSGSLVGYINAAFAVCR